MCRAAAPRSRGLKAFSLLPVICAGRHALVCSWGMLQNEVHQAAPWPESQVCMEGMAPSTPKSSPKQGEHVRVLLLTHKCRTQQATQVGPVTQPEKDPNAARGLLQHIDARVVPHSSTPATLAQRTLGWQDTRETGGILLVHISIRDQGAGRCAP